MHASKSTTQHITKQYINCNTNCYIKLAKQHSPINLPLLHLAISGTMSGYETVHSASFTVF
jgi:hypothetical protein